MKKRGKIVFRVILIAVLIVGIVGAGYYAHEWWQNQEMQKARPNLIKAKDGTNINASWHKYANFIKKN